MSFQDKSIQCSDCGASFILAIKEQEYFKTRGFRQESKRCPDCRDKRSRTERAALKPSVRQAVPIQEAAPVVEPSEVSIGTFESFDLSPNVMTGVRLSGYTIPTPIQAQAIPHSWRAKTLSGWRRRAPARRRPSCCPCFRGWARM